MTMPTPAQFPRGKAARTKISDVKNVPLPAAGQQLEQIRVDLIDVGENVRIQPGELDELAASIAELGVLQPVRVVGPHKDGRYRLVWGQRRLLASRQAGLEYIPAITEISADVDAPGAKRSIEQLVENLQRSDLNPIDEGKALRAVLDGDKSLSQSALAKRLGRSEPWISSALKLLELDDWVQNLIVSGPLSSAHAKPLAALDHKTQIAVAKEVAEHGLSAHATEDYVRRLKDDEAWRKKQSAQQAQEAAAKNEAIARRIEEAGKKIPKDAPIHVGGGYYGNGDQVGHVIKLLQDGGFTEVVKAKDTPQARPKGGMCDCTAWKVEIGWSGGLTIAPACVDKKHTDAAYATKTGEERRQREFQDRVRDRVQAFITEQTLELYHRSPTTARIFLWIAMDWSLNDWVAKHKGDRKKANAWDEIAALSEGEMAVELAKFVRQGFTDRYNIKLDWPRIAAELGLEVEPTA